MTINFKRLLLLNLPYAFIALAATKIGEAWRYSAGLDVSQKVLYLMDGFTLAFQSPWSSLIPNDLILGITIAAGIKLAVYLKGRNAKKYRKNIKYGSARWGKPEDIKPFIDLTFRNNVILTETERMTMNNRPKDPRLARSKNVMVVGSSGTGKTRFWLKPISCSAIPVTWSPTPRAASSWNAATFSCGKAIRSRSSTPSTSASPYLTHFTACLIPTYLIILVN